MKCYLNKHQVFKQALKSYEKRTKHTWVFDLHSTHPLAHGNKGIIIFLQALVGFLIETSKGPKLRPVKTLPLDIINNTECRNHTVKIRFLTSRPSAQERERERGEK